MRTILLTSLFLALLPAACATTAGSDSEPRRNRYLISQEELATQPSLSAYQIIQRLRPAWLQSRGPVTGGAEVDSYPQVMMDGMPFGDINTLKDLRMENIHEFRFISARDATTRFGTGYMAGIIDVITLR